MIETERLVLRRQRLSDFENSFAMWSHPDVVRYISGAPVPRAEAWASFRGAVGHWELLGYGYWIVEEKSTGAFVGEVGFGNFERAIEPPLTVPEAGWVLSPAMHGRGYGTEALRAALAWGDEHFDAPETVAIITPGNDPSFRLAARVGFTERLRTTYREKEIAILFRPRGSRLVALDHVQLAMPAGREAEARAFYAGVLRFEELPKPPELRARGGVWFRSGAVTLHLGVDPAFAPATKAHPAFRCGSYEAFVAELRARNVVVIEDPLPFRGSRHCYVNDAFGNRLEFIEHLGDRPEREATLRSTDAAAVPAEFEPEPVDEQPF